MLDLDNIEEKFHEIIKTREWKNFAEDIDNASSIFIFGNGGQISTAQHAASDISRLLGKPVYSPDNLSFLTSIANDSSYDKIFEAWLKQNLKVNDPTSMVIGLSCSGNSPNVENALEYALTVTNMVHLISGLKSKKFPKSRMICDYEVNEICMETNYYHSSEVLSMLLFYQAVEECDRKCPRLNG